MFSGNGMENKPELISIIRAVKIQSGQLSESRQKYSLLRHAGVFQNVHIDEQCLLVFAHPTQKQRTFLQQPLETQSSIKGASYTLSSTNLNRTYRNVCSVDKFVP